MKTLLDNISSPAELRLLKLEQLSHLAEDLRAFLRQAPGKEGHLRSSLGVTELTIALHYCFNTPEDILIWDVGHQA